MALLSEADMGSCSPDSLVPELSSPEKGARPLQELDPDICLPGSKGKAHFLEFSAIVCRCLSDAPEDLLTRWFSSLVEVPLLLHLLVLVRTY